MRLWRIDWKSLKVVGVLIVASCLLLNPGFAEDTAGKSDDGPPYKNTIRWKTASEVDNFGYDVFRGDAEEGPFTRLNAKPIPGAGTTDETSQYAYEDSTIETGRAYYYYVESISMSGERERMTPVFRSRPKGPGSEAEQPEA